MPKDVSIYYAVYNPTGSIQIIAKDRVVKTSMYIPFGSIEDIAIAFLKKHRTN
jgi:hypothetical protein